MPRVPKFGISPNEDRIPLPYPIGEVEMVRVAVNHSACYSATAADELRPARAPAALHRRLSFPRTGANALPVQRFSGIDYFSSGKENMAKFQSVPTRWLQGKGANLV